MFITSNSIKVAPESVSSQIRAHPVARSCKKHASDIGCICIRLSSFLCCGLASHVRGEAVTQSFSGLSSVSSLASAADHYSFLSPLGISSSFLLFSRFQTSPQHASTYTLSFATLPAFLHTITRGWAYTLRLL